MGESLVAPVAGHAPEPELARDLAKRGVFVAPAIAVAAFIGWGLDGALSAGYALAIVVGNFLLAAAMLAWAARISLVLLMGTALGGYVVRLGLIFAAVFVVRNAAWVELVPLGLTIIVTHLGLLFWEMRYVSASLAYPGLRPSPAGGRKE
jgi:hypothetical protein